MVKIGKFIFFADFVILDIEEDKEISIILGQLSQHRRGLDDVREGKLT